MGLGDYLGKGAKDYVFTRPDNSTVTASAVISAMGEPQEYAQSTRYVERIVLTALSSASINDGDTVIYNGAKHELITGRIVSPALGAGRKVFDLKIEVMQ